MKFRIIVTILTISIIGLFVMVVYQSNELMGQAQELRYQANELSSRNEELKETNENLIVI